MKIGKQISNEEVNRILSEIGWKALIDAIEYGFVADAKGEVEAPAKIYLNTPWSDMRCMPAYMPTYDPDLCGVKIVCVAPDNPKKGLPTTTGVYLLMDAHTQEIRACMEAEEITAWRTAASSAVATRTLARKDSKTLGIIGLGKQAYYHAKAIIGITNIEEILINDISVSAIERFKKIFDTCESENGVTIKNTSNRDICKNSDIITTLTPVREPYIKIEDVSLRTHINAVGADSKDKNEFEPEILLDSTIVCDNIEQCVHSGGEIYHGLEKGWITKNRLKALGDILLGHSGGRRLNTDITFFKSTGVAFQDLMTAIMVYKTIEGEELDPYSY